MYFEFEMLVVLIIDGAFTNNLVDHNHDHDHTNNLSLSRDLPVRARILHGVHMLA